jgi:hypothetical protein
VAETYKDKFKAAAAADRLGTDVLLETYAGLKVMQPDGVSYFVKGNTSGPKLVKKKKGGAVMKARGGTFKGTF